MWSALQRSQDVRAGIVCAVLGLVYLASALQITPDPSAAAVLGPEVAPITIGVAAVICSVGLAVRGWRAPHEPETKSETEAAVADALAGSKSPGSRRQLVVVFLMFAVYIVAFIPLGYLLSTFVFLTVLTTYIDRDKMLRNVLFAGGFSVVVYLLFNELLQVQLPPGLLG